MTAFLIITIVVLLMLINAFLGIGGSSIIDYLKGLFQGK